MGASRSRVSARPSRGAKLSVGESLNETEPAAFASWAPPPALTWVPTENCALIDCRRRKAVGSPKRIRTRFSSTSCVRIRCSASL